LKSNFEDKFIYPTSTYGPELTGMIAFFIIQFIKLHIGDRGNKSEAKQTIKLYIILCLPALLAFYYYGVM